MSALVGLVAASVVPASVAATASDDPAGHGLAVKRSLPERPAKAARSSYDPHTVLVKFKAGTPAKARTAALSARHAQSTGSVGAYVKVRTSGPAADALRSLRTDPSVAVAALDYHRTMAAVPNDPAYTQNFQPYLATVRLPEAWNVVKDTTSQIIAVLDTGVDTAHEDLTGRLVAGYNAVTPGASYGDIAGHGTMVAGIAAANTNNGTGIAGSAWTGRIMPVRVFHLNTTTGEVEASDSDIARGLRWAAEHGARVINMSLGGPVDNVVLHDAVKYATSKGAVVVVAAGNTGGTAPHYPAAYPEVLAAAATDKAGSLTDFSTSGSWVDVAAPGFDIFSTFFDVTDPLAHDWYNQGAGTSFSSPLVAGVTAIVRTRFPTLTAAQVIARIKSTARDAGPRGIDPYYGYGFVDAYAALGGAKAAELASPPFDGNDTPARSTAITTSATSTVGASGDVDWYRYDSGADQTVQFDLTPAVFDNARAQNLDPMLAVYDANLQPLGTADAGAWGDPESLTLPVGTGAVYIAVRNFNGGADTRPYTLSLSSGTGGATTPGEQLWVRDIAPADFSTGAAIGIHPTITFQRELAPASVTTSTVRLVHGYTGATVPSTVAYDGPSKTVTITPNASLQDNTAYRIVVGAVQDAGSATNATEYSSTFRTVDLAPSGVTGFDATGWYQSATLHWTLPAINDLSQVIVRRSTGGAPPATPADGVGVYAGTGTSATASGLGWGGNYAFRAWVKDRSGKLSPLAETRLTGTKATIAQSTSALTYGSSVTLSGKIIRTDTSAALSGASVQLYARQKGSSTWRLLRTATSSSSGTFSFAYKPAAGNDFQWRYFSGNSDLIGSGSPVLFTGVRPVVTAGLSRTTVPRNTTVAISGSVTPKHPGQLVYLQRYLGGGRWTNVTSTKLSSNSIYSFHVKPTTAGSFSYRVVRPADTDHLTGVSPTRTLRVT